jgi:hypothetical protein
MTDLISFDKFQEFWDKDPIVVIDSSSLLDLYRYAPHTSKGIIKNFKEIQNNLWIPGQVLEEYYENKAEVISKAHNKYKNVSKEVHDIIKKAEIDISNKFIRYGKFKYPKISSFKGEIERITTELKDKAKSFETIVSTEINENKSVLDEDQVNALIQTLEEEDQIGPVFSLPAKIDIYQQGEFRYRHLIPPGYMDTEKDKKDPTKRKKYGDLIIWKELLKKAAENERPFIFVTDDEKEDWWDLKKTNSHLGEKVELIGPRVELVSEFNELSRFGEDGFMMVTLPVFNKHISVINHVNKKEAYQSHLELDTEEVVMEIIQHKEWENILDIDNLTNSFIHDGELAEFIDQVLTDVEIQSISYPEFDDLYVDIDEENVHIDGRFRCVINAEIETALSSEYSEMGTATIILTGNIAIELELDYDKEYEDFMDIDKSEITVSSFEISECEYEDMSDYEDIACISCGIMPGAHFTNEGEPVCTKCVSHFDVCTDCGNLYEYGTLGGYICQKCQSILNR